jgi:NAD(P)-dependent dehydrogenase (short-subunit alcohol dehydrogenase family)
MLIDFDLDRFIREKVTRRPVSLLDADLRRDDAQLHAEIDGARALVIGGAGSIGSHYIKALLRFDVAKLCVVDTNENDLTELVRDLRSSGAYRIPNDFITYPVNFGDRVFEKIAAAHGPFDIVANFAAHKHVRSEKDVFSIEAMVENNVLRARGLLDMLSNAPPRHFFCVSTDKAANPVNLMGASKKLMEELILAYADRLPITTARFANVAFSNGSLPIGFLERLFKRQPWSCPLGIRRFFVSPIESGELCLIASVLGASGDIFFPKLDEQRDMIGFDRIAHDLLQALGMDADPCGSEEDARAKIGPILQRSLSPEVAGQHERIRWPVYFFESDTSGEKPYEEFFSKGETLDLDRFINLGIVKDSPRRSLAEIDAIFRELGGLFARPRVSKQEIVEAFRAYLPNFDHIEKGKGLDQRM